MVISSLEPTEENYEAFVLAQELQILNTLADEYSIELTDNDKISMMSEKHNLSEEDMKKFITS